MPLVILLVHNHLTPTAGATQLYLIRRGSYVDLQRDDQENQQTKTGECSLTN